MILNIRVIVGPNFVPIWTGYAISWIDGECLGVDMDSKTHYNPRVSGDRIIGDEVWYFYYGKKGN